MNKEQGDGDGQMPLEDSLEFRLLMAYTRKRRPEDARLQINSTERKTSTAEDNNKQSNKRNKRFKKRFSRLVTCIKPKTHDSVGSKDVRQPAMLSSDAQEMDVVEDMANKLTEIANSVHFVPDSDTLESDGITGQEDSEETFGEDSPDALIQTLVDLLKEHGDKLNEKIMANKALHESLQSSLKYGFFRRLMDRFCTSATQELPPQQEPEQIKVAMICEATSKLFSVDHHPMRRVLGFGTMYLQDKFPMWISRNISNAEIEDEEEVH